jgi:Protein of unknown function (DUF3168)
MLSDVSEVDAAIVTRLLTDPTLAALMPDGVYWDVPPINKRRFVVVSQSTHEDWYQFGGSAYERITYLIKAVEDQSAGANVKAAAARIHVLLQDVTFTIPGYTLMKCQRAERIRVTEADEQNSELRWQQRGGFYEVWVSP